MYRYCEYLLFVSVTVSCVKYAAARFVSFVCLCVSDAKKDPTASLHNRIEEKTRAHSNEIVSNEIVCVCV